MGNETKPDGKTKTGQKQEVTPARPPDTAFDFYDNSDEPATFENVCGKSGAEWFAKRNAEIEAAIAKSSEGRSE